MRFVHSNNVFGGHCCDAQNAYNAGNDDRADDQLDPEHEDQKMKSAASPALSLPSSKEGSSFASMLGRIRDAVVASRQRQADREVARMLHMNGDVLTDAAEREIERRFGFRA